MRINVVPVGLLTDQHLRAEFREIIMSIHYYRRSRNTKTGIDFSKVSKRYTLNSGHGYMWYNKFGYINQRYHSLLIEMQQRQYRTDAIEQKFAPLLHSQVKAEHMNDWAPTKSDMAVNLERILEKIAKKPTWYKYHGKPVDVDSLYGEFKRSLIE